MVPAEPGEAPAVGAETGRAEEVVARDQLPAGVVVPVEVEGDDAVDRLAGGAMVLADREHALAGRIELEIGIAQLAVARGRDRRRAVLAVQTAELLVGEVGRDDDAVPDGVCAAAVFVDPRAHVEGRRGQVGGRARQRAAHQHRAAAFFGPGLEPVGDLAIEHRLRQPDLGGSDQIGADRRCPAAVSCDPCHAFNSPQRRAPEYAQAPGRYQAAAILFLLSFRRAR